MIQNVSIAYNFFVGTSKERVRKKYFVVVFTGELLIYFKFFL